MSKVAVSVLIVTHNEEPRLAKCLAALTPFDQIIVVDSQSTDNTVSVAKSMGAECVPFVWDGQYPKKRQWCLDHVPLRHNFVFMVDADEIVTPELIAEIEVLFAAGEPSNAGYFVRGQYARGGDVLCYGLKNNKLALFNRHKMEFPVVDDLDIDGMGEIEGHYQPVLKVAYGDADRDVGDVDAAAIGQLSHGLIHDAYGYDGGVAWTARHLRYARWEAMMDMRGAWPQDPVVKRNVMKAYFKKMPFRPLVAFMHCYVLRFGFLDGQQGFLFARDRYRYYRMIAAAAKELRTLPVGTRFDAPV